MPRDDAVKKLEGSFQERQAGLGLSGHGSMMVELYVSQEGSWTILTTRTNGLSCITASGDAWQHVEPEYGQQS